MKKKKKKLELDDIEIQSFITSDNEDLLIQGGTNGNCPSDGTFACESARSVPCRTACLPCPTANSNGCTCWSYFPCNCPSPNQQSCYLCVTCLNPNVCPHSGGGGAGGCFLADTLVNTTYNEYKCIQDLNQGDIVLSFNEKTQAIEYNPVSNLFQTVQPYYYVINGNIKTTAPHPFLVNGAWTEVKDIKKGDELFDCNLNKIKVHSIDIVNQEISVYNLEVADCHTFFVHNILVHNKQQTNIGPRCQTGGNT